MTGLLAGIAGRTEQAGILVATASVPRTFQRTLMPRSTADQAIITGAVVAAHYGLAVLTHDTLEAVAQWWDPTDLSEAEDRALRKRMAALDAAGWLGGWGLRLAFKERPGEHLSRGAVRTAGLIVTRTCFSGLIVSALQQGAHSLDERAGSSRFRRMPVALLGGLAVGAIDRYLRKRGVEQTVHDSNEDESLLSGGKSLAISGVVTAALAGMAATERGLARVLSTRLERVMPGRERGWRNVGHILALGAIGGAGMAGVHRMYATIEATASTYEPGIDSPPETEFVSGGPGSLVPYLTLSRQGRRHVKTYVRPEWIERVMGEPPKAHPIRVFVGLDSAPTMEERVELAIAELERTGAFDRSLLLIVSPTGTGYVNYAAVESVEYMTRGDCATVTMQYSKRPSPLSLGRVDVGREQNYMLIQAIFERLETTPGPERQRVVLFGESLGAHTSQDAFVHRGTRGLQDRGIDRALWIGTPFASEWKEEVLGRPRYDVRRSMVGVFNDIEELEALTPEQRDELRYVMLTHHNDAVAYFGPELLLACPRWLGDPDQRPPGVPKSVVYGPVLTFMQTFVDMKNSANVIPGQFEAKGHDYRADLSRFVRAVFDLEATDEQIGKIDEAMREFELFRAKWIADHKKEQQASAGGD